MGKVGVEVGQWLTFDPLGKVSLLAVLFPEAGVHTPQVGVPLEGQGPDEGGLVGAQSLHGMVELLSIVVHHLLTHGKENQGF